MRVIFVIVILMISVFECKSQVDIQLGGQIGHVWRSSKTIHAGYMLGDHKVLLGYYYNKDCRPEFEYNNTFKRRFFGRSAKEKSSISVEYVYDPKWLKKDWNPFFFSSLTYSHAPVNHINYLPVAYFEEGPAAYIRLEMNSLPMYALEFYCGVGIRFELWKNLYLFTKASLGYNYFINYELPNSFQVKNMGEYGAKFGFGLGYTFGPPK